MKRLFTESTRRQWYLDKLVALQKREVHLNLIKRWTTERSPQRVLKTDLFEEAYGLDQILDGLFPVACMLCGMDKVPSTVCMAAKRFPRLSKSAVVTDIRSAAFCDEAFDLILSISTLDHFISRLEYLEAMRELARLLAPGGALILTLDNPSNPLYYVLKCFSRTTASPFSLGYTPSRAALHRDLTEIGLAICDTAWVLHNPRGISTLVFLLLRRCLHTRADVPIRLLLSLFDSLGRLPVRRFTACFQAVLAVKRAPVCQVS